MAAVADPSSYQEVISQLGAYTNKVFESTSNMMSAANTCASNMEGDPAADRSVAALQRSISQIIAGVQKINKIMAAMRRELDDIQAAANKANF